MPVDIRPLEAPLGAEVSGLDLTRPLDDSTVADLFEALDARILLLFRALPAPLANEDLVRFANYFGPLRRRAPDASIVPSAPDINLVSNTDDDGVRGIAGADIIDWHSDMAFQLPVTQYIVLDAVEIPPPSRAGTTMYTNLYAAYDALPAERKGEIDGLEVEYAMRAGVGEGNYYSQILAEHELPHIRHALVQVHPRTKRKSLWPNGGFIDSTIPLLPAAEGLELMTEMRRHVTDTRFVYEHRWQPGDLLIWDNITSMHYRTAFDPNHRRVMRHLSVMRGDEHRDPGSSAGQHVLVDR